MSLYTSIPGDATKIDRSSANNSTSSSKQLPAVQMVSEEEDALQGKFEAVQKMTPEEEPIQSKFETTQMVSTEKEEPLQGKFIPVQKKN